MSGIATLLSLIKKEIAVLFYWYWSMNDDTCGHEELFPNNPEEILYQYSDEGKKRQKIK
jgi:hypothetical protein